MIILAGALIALTAQMPGWGGVARLDTGGIAPDPSGGVAPAAAPRDEQGRPTMVNGGRVTYVSPEPSNLVTPTPAEIAMVVISTFPTMDLDHSGFIEADEAPVAGETREIYNRDEEGNVLDTGRTVTVTTEQARAQYIAMGDENGDGKLSFSEFRAWMAPNIARSGIPAKWRGDIERNYRASAD
jgi:hypothetical protein